MAEATLKVLIVDDEPLARQGLARMVNAHGGFEVARLCSNGRDAVLALREQEFDLVLLDVEMPELDGFGVLVEIGVDAMPQVVFVTAFDRYALRAFEAHALDYVLKPVEPERLAKSLQRARRMLTAGAPGSRLAELLEEIDERKALPNHIAARSGGRTKLIPVDEIRWLKAAGNYVRLHMGEEMTLHRETLAQLHRRLDPKLFLRVHRSHVVNLSYVRELRPGGHGDAQLFMANGTKLRVARGYRSGIEQALKDL